MSHYDTLGVHPDADGEAIAKAARKRMQKMHPDKGGDEEKFRAVVVAKEVLLDPERRKRYDETGSDSERLNSREAEMRHTVVSTFLSIVDQLGDGDVDVTNIVQVMVNGMEQQATLHMQEIRNIERQIVKRERAIKRFRKKNKNADPLVPAMLAHAVEAMRKKVANGHEAIEQVRALIEFTKQFDYEVTDVPAEYRGMFGQQIKWTGPTA